MSSPSSPDRLAASPPEALVLGKVLEALRSIEYGSVLVKIHQGEVVGIEMSTKVRFTESPGHS